MWHLAFHYMMNARRWADADIGAVTWVARHARQSIAELEAMGMQKFKAVYRHLLDIVQNEWTAPGE